MRVGLQVTLKVVDATLRGMAPDEADELRLDVPTDDGTRRLYPVTSRWATPANRLRPATWSARRARRCISPWSQPRRCCTTPNVTAWSPRR
jgi:hypothetical protein